MIDEIKHKIYTHSVYYNRRKGKKDNQLVQTALLLRKGDNLSVIELKLVHAATVVSNDMKYIQHILPMF